MTNANELALAAYEARLRAFDWWYKYNDTYEYWREADRIHAELVKIAGTHPEFAEAYERIRAEKGPEKL